jgi:AraC family transcriptional regulator
MTEREHDPAYQRPRHELWKAVYATDCVTPQAIHAALVAHAHDPLVQQLGQALLGELAQGERANQRYIDSLAQALAQHLRLRTTRDPAPAAPYDPAPGLADSTLQAVLAYIDAHLARALPLAEVAELARISQYHFARLFRQSLGCSLHQYVTERRLERARQLLAAGGHSIAEVAALTGFVDQSHLHRYFKRRYGVTPGAALGCSTNIQSTRTNIQDESAADPLG